MPIFYSNHYSIGDPNDVVVPNVALAPDDPAIKVAPGIKHATMRVSRAEILMTGLANPTAADFIRMMSLKSSDRIYDLRVIGVGNTTTAANIGLYESGENHDGVVIDADLFASALLLTTAARTDRFTESSDLADEDRGKQLWELAALGDGSYTSDPNEVWDIVLDLTAVGTEDTVVLEVKYTAGGN